MRKIHTQTILFESGGATLVGRLLRDTLDLQVRQPGVVVTGSWLTVKEQMATTYGEALAAAGHTVLIFDFAGFGESGGEPRQVERPERKIADLAAAARFLAGLGVVAGDRVGVVAVCASAMYAAAAAQRERAIGAITAVAGWFHDPASLVPFYGEAAGVSDRLSRAERATAGWLGGHETSFAPAYAPGDDRAGMAFPMDYYANANRGAVPAWRNEMSEISWAYWLTFDGRRATRRLAAPTLFVHGDGCVFPDAIREIAETNDGLASLLWLEGEQTDFYDRPALVSQATIAATAHFARNLGGEP